MTHLLRVYSTLELRKIGLRINCPLEDRLVLVHTSIGEKQSWVRERYDRRRRDL